MKFYLGTHIPSWVYQTDVPLFLSHRILSKRKKLQVALGPYCVDSGGFSELSMYGEWKTTPEQYVAELQRYEGGMGKFDWAAPQDWMCEPWILGKTGESIATHQRRTIESVLYLRSALPKFRIIPVLQGWELNDYVTHTRMYENSGVDLVAEDTVGVGSVCRRQSTKDAEEIFRELYSMGLRTHGFGVKLAGLRRYREVLKSADSMAWSFSARYNRDRIEGHSHMNCANCLEYALNWRKELLCSLK